MSGGTLERWKAEEAQITRPLSDKIDKLKCSIEEGAQLQSFPFWSWSWQERPNSGNLVRRGEGSSKLAAGRWVLAVNEMGSDGGLTKHHHIKQKLR